MVAKKRDPYRFFKIEAQELLEKMNMGFLALEKAPDADTLNELFRCAHTMKGAARLVQLNNIGSIAHHLESAMGEAQKQKNDLTPEQIDRFLKSLDTIALVLELIENKQDPHIDVQPILDLLDGKSETLEKPTERETTQTLEPSIETIENGFSKEKQNDLSQEVPLLDTATQPEPLIIDTETQKESQSVKKVPVSQPTASNKELSQEQDETIRINLSTLNNILNLGGELVINKIKLQEKQNQLKFIKSLMNQNANFIEFWERMKSIPEVVNAKKNSDLLKDLFAELENGIQVQKAIRSKITQFSDEYEEDIKLTHFISLQLQEEAFKARMLPVDTILSGFDRLVRDLARELEKKVQLEVKGREILIDKKILDGLHGPLTHLIRNALDHGMELPDYRESMGKSPEGSLKLTFEQRNRSLFITLEDDGAGIDVEKIRSKILSKKLLSEKQLEEMSENEILYFILEPQFSTADIITNLSGRGVGLDVVQSMVSNLKGSITIKSVLGQFTRFILQLPQSLSNLPSILFECGQEILLLPLSNIRQTLRLSPDDIEKEGTREVAKIDGKAIPLVRLSQLLELPDDELMTTKIPTVVVHSRDDEVAFTVQKLHGVKEVVVKNLGRQIKKVPNIGGSTILGNGHPVIILDPNELIQNAKGGTFQGFKLGMDAKEDDQKTSKILIVDDSLTTRMMEKTILESVGYEVELATSAEEAVEKSTQNDYRLFIVDIEMPGMNGFELTQALRKEKKTQNTPIIIVSSLATKEVKQRGIEVGAQAYIVKGEFDQNILLETVDTFLSRSIE